MNLPLSDGVPYCYHLSLTSPSLRMHGSYKPFYSVICSVLGPKDAHEHVTSEGTRQWFCIRRGEVGLTDAHGPSHRIGTNAQVEDKHHL